ncbi:methanethiol S-methyltransferase [Roseovarius sp.]|uniref:methanethiol S-methyltransferase n=1 Tax=Roseovarius sp. TaxID=1486281 RepID=UPI003A970524
MVRSTACLYGLIVYLIFLVTFLYTIGFLGNILVPKSIDSGTPGPITASILVNLALLSLFALQHSIMARPAFKPVWTRMIPKVAERSTYVQATCVALILIFLFWQPIPNLIWNFESSITGVTLNSLFWGGWLVVLSSTFMIDQLGLFGLKQVFAHLKKRQAVHPNFVKTDLYRLVRHPIMTGFLIVFWTAPSMSVSHLLFTLVTTGYIMIAVLQLEEKDLIVSFGDDYLTYQSEVPAFVPGLRRGR